MTYSIVQDVGKVSVAVLDDEDGESKSVRLDAAVERVVARVDAKPKSTTHGLVDSSLCGAPEAKCAKTAPKRQENGPRTAAEAQNGPPRCLNLSRRAAVPGAATDLAAKLVFWAVLG